MQVSICSVRAFQAGWKPMAVPSGRASAGSSGGMSSAFGRLMPSGGQASTDQGGAVTGGSGRGSLATG